MKEQISDVGFPIPGIRLGLPSLSYTTILRFLSASRRSGCGEACSERQLESADAKTRVEHP